MSPLIRRDIRLILGGSEGLSAILFFTVVTALFAFVLGSTPDLLRAAAPAVIWVAALLAALLALEAVYHRDYDDGTFDLLFMSPLSHTGIVAAKMAAHWIVTGLPIVVTGFVVAHMLFLPVEILPALLASLALGTIYLSLLGGLAAVLTLGSRRPGLLLALLILPLFVPMLTLGVLAAEAALAGLPVRAYLLLQLALVVAALPVAPWAAGAFLNMNLRSS